MSSFSDPQIVARYAEGPVRQVPGFHALQRMAALLLAERVPEDGHVLVLGAGGGLELKSFAESQAGWRFLGIDPSAEMLKLADATLGPLASRVQLLHGYIDAAPEISFDGATCLLTLHFLSVEERMHTLRELKRRLKPGAPLVVAHHSFPQGGREKTRWLDRYAAFAVASGIPPSNARAAIDAIGARLPVLSPEQDVALLQEAGYCRKQASARLNCSMQGSHSRGGSLTPPHDACCETQPIHVKTPERLPTLPGRTASIGIAISDI